MSKTHSLTVFNGEADNFYDPNFSVDINRKMRVPRNIRVSGDYSDDDASTNGATWNSPGSSENFDMHVPDRILVVGQNQHIGLKAPIEMALDNSMMQQPERGLVRVQTPPRVLTLDDHFFPTLDDGNDVESFGNISDLNATLPKSSRPFVSETQIVRRPAREQTPIYSSLDVSLPPSEEIQHLRRQVGKLNRRVMSVELELVQRQQRDRILYAVTIAYFFLKAFNWLSRN